MQEFLPVDPVTLFVEVTAGGSDGFDFEIEHGLAPPCGTYLATVRDGWHEATAVLTVTRGAEPSGIRRSVVASLDHASHVPSAHSTVTIELVGAAASGAAE